MKAKSLLIGSSLLVMVAFSPQTRSDVISEWRQTASDYLAQNASGQELRAMAMVHLAQFDAINAISGGYTPYAVSIRAPNASPEAAAAQAAYAVLTNISRASLSTLNNALARSLDSIPNGTARETGLQLGAFVANAIVELRAADNLDLSLSAPSSTAIGRWRPTPPSLTPGVAAQLRYFTPFTMRTVAQFRQGPPPALNSEKYATDYNEVRLMGARNSTTRTAEQTVAARFYESLEGAEFLRGAQATRSLSLIESARIHALYYMVFADTVVSVCTTKYAYNFWRPITAIRAGERDGNDNTPGDTTWNSFYDTHPHPDYPSQASQVTGGLVELLISVYGDASALEISPVGFVQPRKFGRLSDLFEDVVVGRIAAGMHFRNSCVVAVDTGRRIARHALENYLRPVPNISGATGPNPGQFQLQLNPGRPLSYVIESSSDLIQWQSWKTNVYGVVVETDENAAAVDRRFYRALISMP